MNTVNVTVTATGAEVYRRGCTITYRGIVTLAEGESHLVIEGLPAGLDDGSVSVRMPKAVSLGQVRVVREDVGFMIDALDEPTELDQQLDELDRRIANKELELDAWKGLAAKLNGNTALDYLERYPAKLDELSGELSALRAERRAATQRRDKEREERERPWLELDVAAAQAGEMPFELSCRSDEAGWTPSYDVLVDDLASPLRLRMKGSAWQRTGMDWENVTLRLSTGTAAVLGDLPRFVPRYLQKAEPRSAYAPAARAKGKGMRMAAPLMELDFAAASAAVPSASADDTLGGFGFDDMVEAAAPEAEVVEQATATTYELPGAQTLATGGAEQLFTLATTELAATYHLYAYPRRDEAAYLVAHLEAEPAPEVLERQLSVYIEGSYAGTIRIGRATDEHGYELPLGRDGRVRIRRTEAVNRSTKLFGGKVVVEHVCDLSVESRTRAPMDIVVVEQVPVSRDSDIEVTLREGSGAAYDKERGELRWERTLAPEERFTLSATYVISHAKGLLVDESAPQVGTRGGTTFCPRCGRPLEPGARFCLGCGSAIR